MATPSIPVRVDISSAVEGVRNLQSLNRELRNLREKNKKQIADPTREMRRGMRRTSEIAREVQRSLVQAFSAGVIVQAVRSAVKAFEEAELALGRLSSSARVAGESFADANEAAVALASEGIGSVAEVSASLSNLLASGFNLEDSVRLLRALGDVGAFGRTQIESLGQAVVTTTRGLRANRAALIDNIGITRSLSDVWAEYAASLGVSEAELTQNQRNQATLNFVLEEGADRAGDLARLQGTLSGQLERARVRVRELAAEFGAALAPSIRGVISIMEFVLPLFRRWIGLWQGVGAAAGFAAKTIVDAASAIQNLSLDQFTQAFTANLQAFRAQIEDIRRQATTGGLAAPGDAGPGDAAVRAAREAEGDQLSAKAEKARENRLKRAASARAAAARKAERERLKAARLAAREEEQIEEALARARIEIATTTGTLTAQARRDAIAREFEETRALLETRGNAAGIALLDNLIDVRAAEARFNELEAVLSRNLAQIQQRQSIIQTQQSAGLLTEAQAREAIIGLQQESSAELERMIPLLEEAAAALGPEAAADVARWKTELEQASIVVNDVALRLRGEFGNALTEFFVDLGEGAKSAKEAFLDLARSILSSIQRILAERFAQQLLGSFLGGAGGAGGGGLLGGLFSGLGFAQGGPVSGPGTGTSDSIPARLSAGEYVVRASAVGAVGTGFLDAINSLGRGLRAPALRFAEGGAVPAMAAAAPAGIRVVNVLDPELARDYVESSGGERSVLNIIERNRGAVQQMLR